jgi:hypothetical protein
MCWTGPAGIPAQNQRISGEILPNSYALEQIGEPGTQDMTFGVWRLLISDENFRAVVGN